MILFNFLSELIQGVYYFAFLSHLKRATSKLTPSHRFCSIFCKTAIFARWLLCAGNCFSYNFDNFFNLLQVGYVVIGCVVIFKYKVA